MTAASNKEGGLTAHEAVAQLKRQPVISLEVC